MGISFSYFIGQSPGLGVSTESESITKIRKIALDYLSKGLVSAEEGLWTCLEDKNGSFCQEYPSEICNERCNEDCIPTRREETSECRLGTCVDPDEGICAAQSPRLQCESSGGNWFEQEPAECRPGCCLIGGQANYITEQACSTLSNRLGKEFDFEYVENELACLIKAEQQEKGACLLGQNPEGQYDCKFGTKAECISIGGDFQLNKLCTDPELNTSCLVTEETQCFDGEDEVYFIDSCGNRANIYDYSKKNNIGYWSDIVGKNESCNLDGNQAECGNCEYLSGNICGLPGEKDKEARIGEFVCRDLGCVDEWGDERKNGESWCAFDSQIGVENKGDGNKGRSRDLPGSGHYRKVCLDGEVRTEACADYRNEICSETRDEEVGFSSSACRINGWQSCIAANTDKEKLNKCEANSDCFLKNVRISNFKFDVCAPKHPPGFDLRADYGGEVGESICSAGSQVCRVVQVKGFGGWRCEQNCGCLEPGFAQTMNNLCISLGDCGGNVNIEGQFTSDGYSVKRSPKLGEGYISGLKEYAEPVKGQKADPKPLNETAALFGLDPSDPEFDSKLANIVAGLGAGSLGVIFTAGVLFYPGGVTGVISLISSQGLSGLTSILQGGAFYLDGMLGSFASYAGAAAAGAAIGFLVGKLFGLQGDGLLAVTIAGVFAGLASYTGFFGATSGTGLFTFGFFVWTIILVLIIALIIKFLGIGDTRIVKVSFSCMPWQPPLGGASCESCGEDGLPCSKYKCQSLGQTCELVNEGTGEEACIDSNPNDGAAPKISPNYEAISEDFEYSEVSDSGFKVIHRENECIPAYTPVNFGISLNEVGQCKYDTLHTEKYEDMEFFFGESSLFKKNHITSIIMPSLDSLGEPGFDPDRRADFPLYVRCMDANGNANTAEYAISFCVSPEDDITSPILKNFDPANPGYVSLDSREMNLTFFTNEPAECRYSIQDKEYNAMENNVQCNNDLEDLTLFGFECNTLLPVVGNTSTYYLRCSDQPWLNESSERNVNRQSTNYTIIKTQTPLLIEEISLDPEPEDGVISTGNVPLTLDLEVKTSGGAPVERRCQYRFGSGNFIDFFETGENLHKQRFSTLFEGNYNISIHCQDSAGNPADGSTSFIVDLDNEGPDISRVYSQGESLYVITNEESQCYYDHNSCSFSEGIEMSGRDLVHTTEFIPNRNYYIKCKDDYGNTGMCTTVRAGY